MNPGYVYWCMAHLTPMSSRLCFYIDDFAMNEISALYPQFIVPKEFEAQRQANKLFLNIEDNLPWHRPSSVQTKEKDSAAESELIEEYEADFIEVQQLSMMIVGSMVIMQGPGRRMWKGIAMMI